MNFILHCVQSIIQKKTNIRRQRREIFLQDQKQKQAQAAEKSRQQEYQPLRQVENYSYTAPSNVHADRSPHSSPSKPPLQKSDGVTVAFGRTTKYQHQRSPSAGKSMVRRHSLENDSVSYIFCCLAQFIRIIANLKTSETAVLVYHFLA